jgi:hypothetical protein
MSLLSKFNSHAAGWPRFRLGLVYGCAFFWLIMEMPLGEILLVYEDF